MSSLRHISEKERLKRLEDKVRELEEYNHYQEKCISSLSENKKPSKRSVAYYFFGLALLMIFGSYLFDHIRQSDRILYAVYIVITYTVFCTGLHFYNK